MSTRKVPELHDDPDLAGLLREAGRRPGPAAAAEAAVRAVVAAEWRQVVAEQAARRQARRRPGFVAALALAASVAGLAFFVLREPGISLSPQPVLAGTVTRVVGPAQVARRGDEWQAAVERQPVTAGSALSTGNGGRMAVSLPGGGELRLDEGTRLAFVADDAIDLTGGAVYFDTGATSGRAARDFAIRTPRGVVRHVGTQFQVRAVPDAGPVVVSIREGRVEIATPADRVEVPAGNRVTLLADGSRTRAAVAATDAEWAWTGRVAPPFDIEQHTLAEFLAWVARETGRRLEFPSAADRAAAEQVRLRGSVQGLTPEQALPAVMSTTRFAYRLEGAEIAVTRRR